MGGRGEEVVDGDPAARVMAVDVASMPGRPGRSERWMGGMEWTGGMDSGRKERQAEATVERWAGATSG